MSKEIELDGLDEVLNKMDLFTDVSKLENNIKKACAIVEREAKKKAPKGIGELRRSIKSEVSNLEGVVYTPLEYAPYVEFGTGLFAENGGRQDVPWSYKDDEGNWHSTSGMHPHPFMRPALNENREQILRLLEEGLAND